MLIGIELHPAMGGAHKLCEMLIKNGVLTKETRKHVLRLAPPLVISDADMMKGVDITIETIKQMYAQADQGAISASP
jgi:ornithine--oxo-acid transaminase